MSCTALKLFVRSLPAGSWDREDIMTTEHHDTITRTGLSGGQGNADQFNENVSSSREIMLTGPAKTGATTSVGWVVADAVTDIGELATLAASATADTLIVSVTGLLIGDTITAFSVNGQIESGGNAATVDAQLYKNTITAAANVGAGLGSGITQVSVTADSVFAESESGLTQTVAIGEAYYILVTATTGASTDVALTSCTVTVETP